MPSRKNGGKSIDDNLLMKRVGVMHFNRLPHQENKHRPQITKNRDKEDRHGERKILLRGVQTNFRFRQISSTKANSANNKILQLNIDYTFPIQGTAAATSTLYHQSKTTSTSTSNHSSNQSANYNRVRVRCAIRKKR